MLVIRLNRVGRKNKAQFRIVVQEHTAAPSGRHIAIVGSYDPHTKVVILKADEIKEYMANGAQPSDTVHNLLVREGVIDAKKRSVKMPDEVNAEGKEGEGDAKGKEEKKEAPAEAKKELADKEEKTPVKEDSKKESEPAVQEEKESAPAKAQEEKETPKKSDKKEAK